MSHAAHMLSAADRQLPLRTRGDLQITKVAFGGTDSFVVKDPVTDGTFQLSVEEHRLLMALRRSASLGDLQKLIETEFAPHRAPLRDIQQFVNQLYAHGLLIGQNPGQGAELATRAAERRRRERFMKFTRLLAIRIGGIPAPPLVEPAYRMLRWACSPWIVAASLAFVVYAAVLVVGNATEIAARFPALDELARPSRLPAWIAAIAVVKILHETAHAVACRHFGARPQEVGVLLLVGAPALYCDVSDAWRLPNKWQRIAVSSAGMYMELIIASAAAVVWAYTEPGIISAVCLSLIVVCSVGTLVVNANPLLRYDGYFILSDLLETPNLAERARNLVSSAWRRWLFGERNAPEPLLRPRKRLAVWMYAILSKLYFALLLAGIFVVALKLARPHHLENVVYTLTAVVLAGMAIPSIAGAVRLLANPFIRSKIRYMRLLATLLMLLSLGAVVLMIPVTRWVEAPIAAVPAHSHPVFAVASGEIAYAVAEGSDVQPGDVLVRLRNPEIELSLAATRTEVRQKRLRLEQLRTLQALTPKMAKEIPTAAAELIDAEARLSVQQSLADTLTVKAPVAGRVHAPPHRKIELRGQDLLPPWSGSPLGPRNIGAWMDAGTALAIVTEPGEWIGWAGVQQSDVSAVEIGQEARVLAESHPMEPLTGVVAHISRRSRTNAPPGSVTPPNQPNLFGDERYHVVEIALKAPEVPLLPGARGIAKIAAHRSTVGELLTMHLRRAIRRVF